MVPIVRTCIMETLIMRQSRRRHPVVRSSRLESIEPRLLLSGVPVSDPLLHHPVDDAGSAQICVSSIDAYGSTSGMK